MVGHGKGEKKRGGGKKEKNFNLRDAIQEEYKKRKFRDDDEEDSYSKKPSKRRNDLSNETKARSSGNTIIKDNKVIILFAQ